MSGAWWRRWISDIEAYTPNSKVDYPIIADHNREIATLCAPDCASRRCSP